MKKSQMVRIVEFDRHVRQGEYPNSLRFSVDYEVSQRTVLRDIEYLRDQLGAPLQYDPQRKGFCYSEEWDLPQVIPMSVLHEDAASHLIAMFRSLAAEDRACVLRELTMIEGAESSAEDESKAAQIIEVSGPIYTVGMNEMNGSRKPASNPRRHRGGGEPCRLLRAPVSKGPTLGPRRNTVATPPEA